MSKVAEYLQDHLAGEVSASPDVRQIYAQDASILQQLPQLVVFPKNENDVRKVARFSWQLAERGKILPIVARGNGTDVTGASIGQAMSLAMTRHMNRILQFDAKKREIICEAGANFGNVQHILTFSHGQFIPAYPTSFEYSSIGGALANNVSGLQHIKYGSILRYVKNLRVVLANGEVIETGRLSKRDVRKKMGLTTYEGEIYRSVDALLDQNEHKIAELFKDDELSNAGFHLSYVRNKEGSVDLTPLFIGSKGTLGIITEATILTETYPSSRSVYVVVPRDYAALATLQEKIAIHRPCVLSFFDNSLLDIARLDHPGFLKNHGGDAAGAGILVVEFDDLSAKLASRMTKKIAKDAKDVGQLLNLDNDIASAAADKLHGLVGHLMQRKFSGRQLLPALSSAVIPTKQLANFIPAAAQLLSQSGLPGALQAYGQIVQAYPLLDLGQLGDRQRILRLIDAYAELVLKHDGAVIGPEGDGRLHGHLSRKQHGDVLYDIMSKLRHIFDPYQTLNPEVKASNDPRQLQALLRQEYQTPHR